MTFEELWERHRERYGEALQEQRKAFNEFYDFLMVEAREAAAAGRPIDPDRFKRLRARVEETRKKVQDIEELLLSAVED